MHDLENVLHSHALSHLLESHILLIGDCANRQCRTELDKLEGLVLAMRTSADLEQMKRMEEALFRDGRHTPKTLIREVGLA